MGTVAASTSDLELYSDDALLDPYPRVQELRVLGGELGDVAPTLNDVLHGLVTCVVTVHSWP